MIIAAPWRDRRRQGQSRVPSEGVTNPPLKAKLAAFSGQREGGYLTPIGARDSAPAPFAPAARPAHIRDSANVPCGHNRVCPVRRGGGGRPVLFRARTVGSCRLRRGRPRPGAEDP